MKTQILPYKYFVFVFVAFIFYFSMTEAIYGANLDVGEPRTVRLIYFLPNDRPYRPDVVQKIKKDIRAIQTFYAEQMQAHGYGKKTFRLETDARGTPKVHRVDGQHSDRHYVVNGGYWQEVFQKFDPGAVYFLVWDNSSGMIATGVGSKNWGQAKVGSRFSFVVGAHELGHAFGLGHDYRAAPKCIMGSNGNRLCAWDAEFLAKHPYFNAAVPIEQGTPPNIELSSPSTYPPGSKRITIRLKVSDADGIHQVRLYAGTSRSGSLFACRGLKGKKNAIAEFEYNVLIGYLQRFSDSLTHPVHVEAVDTNGNVGDTSFILSEDVPQRIPTLKGHTSWIGALAFSPDGKTLTSASGDGKIRRWDVAKQRTIATFGRDINRILSVVFSPNNKKIAFGSADGTVRLWDVATRRNIATFDGHTKEVLSVAFSPNNKKIASGSADGTVRLWDVVTGRNIATFDGHTKEVLSVAFSPNNKKIASGSYDGTVRLWDVVTGRNITTFLERKHLYPTSVVFSPDGMNLASGSASPYGGSPVPRIVRVRGLSGQKGDIAFEHRYGILSVAFSPDGTVIASALENGTVMLWDLTSSDEITRFPHASAVLSMAFSSDGATLAAGTRNGTVNLWNVPPKVFELWNVPPKVHPTKFRRPPMYWIDTETNTLQMLTGTIVKPFALSVTNPTSIAVDTKRNTLYWTEKTSNRTGKIKRANLEGNPNVKLIKDLTSVPHSIALDLVNRKIYFTNSWGKVQRMNFDGSNFQSNLITGLDAPQNIVLDTTKRKLYWTEQTSDTTGRIRRANLDGSNVQLVRELTDVPLDLAIDAVNGTLYWTERTSFGGQILRLNVDGSNFKANFLGTDSPNGIAVDITNEKLYWTEAGSIRWANTNAPHFGNVIVYELRGVPTGLILGDVPADAPAAPTIVGIPPTATMLLSNYPNPFNPETWIPYQLATDSDVKVTIYDGRGIVVRELVLGHQAPGFYTSRSRAAYWDGRNALGERVASGIYFYQLRTDNVSSLRKMLILK